MAAVEFSDYGFRARPEPTRRSMPANSDPTDPSSYPTSPGQRTTLTVIESWTATVDQSSDDGSLLRGTGFMTTDMPGAMGGSYSAIDTGYVHGPCNYSLTFTRG